MCRQLLFVVTIAWFSLVLQRAAARQNAWECDPILPFLSTPPSLSAPAPACCFWGRLYRKLFLSHIVFLCCFRALELYQHTSCAGHYIWPATMCMAKKFCYVLATRM